MLKRVQHDRIGRGNEMLKRVQHDRIGRGNEMLKLVQYDRTMREMGKGDAETSSV
jgi:hypothetical protein